MTILRLSQTEGFVASCMKDWADDRSRAYLLVPHGNGDVPVGMLEAFSELALSLPEYFRIQATCDVENVASARTLEKSGFVREGRLGRHTVIPNVSDEPRASFMYARCK